MKTMLLYLCLCVLLASGCASRGPIGSFAGLLPEKDAVSAIAGDAVSILTELYPPGHTTLHVLPTKKENGFALALDNALRTKGFTLADDPKAITIAYTLDALELKAAWYLHLRLSDGTAIARVYDAQGQPEAGQSRTLLSASWFAGFKDAVREKAGNAYDATRDFLQQ
jgi:hypothetical protein